ncbi:hypothetical protein Tco_1532900 [Tanacetum coccineum]
MNDVLKVVQSLVEKLRQQEQAANLSTHTPEPSRRFNFIYDDDDDDEERTIPFNEIISQLPPSIASQPYSPEIGAHVEDLVPIPSKSEDTSDNGSECDLLFCDDSPPIDVLGGNYVTFFNPLFDANDDFTYGDDESLTEEDVLEENFKIYLNPLFEFDEEYISSDGDILLLEKLLNDDISFPLPPKELHFEGLKVIKSYVSTDIKDGYHDSEGDIIYLKSFLINDTIPNLPPKVFFDHDPKSLNDEPDNDDLKSMIKVFDPEIHEKIISSTYFLFLRAGGIWKSDEDFSILLFLPQGQRNSRRDCPDYEDSRARGFVHRSLKLQSLARLFMGIRYPRSY